MFTGIIEEVGTIITTSPGKLVVGAGGILPGVKLGESIAVNGVCLTVTSFEPKSFSVDIMPETKQRSNLGSLRTGDKVNLERAMTLGGRLSGHLVQGHIDATGRVVSLNWEGPALLVRCEAPPEVMRYVVEKGFIAVDGISLTVAARDADSFQVSMVDFTRKHTILGERKAGDPVNLEVDIIAKYVEQLNHVRHAGITADFLAKHGFISS
ncbi:MAG: riboflavin synthase [Dehalococcoidales bacterium]|nr:riboflavin synthase [Dehalococcoidales bacterium]